MVLRSFQQNENGNTVILAVLMLAIASSILLIAISKQNTTAFVQIGNVVNKTQAFYMNEASTVRVAVALMTEVIDQSESPLLLVSPSQYAAPSAATLRYPANNLNYRMADAVSNGPNYYRSLQFPTNPQQGADCGSGSPTVTLPDLTVLNVCQIIEQSFIFINQRSNVAPSFPRSPSHVDVRHRVLLARDPANRPHLYDLGYFYGATSFVRAYSSYFEGDSSSGRTFERRDQFIFLPFANPLKTNISPMAPATGGGG